MGHLRERYNAKARRSSRPSKRAKHSHPVTEAIPTSTTKNNDPNTLIHVPKSKDQKDQERRERLRQELLEQQANSRVTSKKKRRLEKYIDKKLKKEERVQILEKLAQTQAQLSTLLHLQPSSTLGSRKARTHGDLQAKQEDKEVRRMIERRTKGGRRKGIPYSGLDTDLEGETSGSESEDARGGDIREGAESIGEPDGSRASPIVIRDEESFSDDHTSAQPAVPAEVSVGSALRRKEDGTVQGPIVVKRNSKGPRTAFKGWGKRGRKNTVEMEPVSDSSFDSSDSAYDSSDGEEQQDSVEGNTESDEASGGFGSDVSNEEESNSEEEEESPPSSPKRKGSGFKDWAMQQLSVAKGYAAPRTTDEPDHTSTLRIPSPKAQKARISTGHHEMKGPLGEELQLPDTVLAEQLKGTSPNELNESTSQKTRRNFATVNRPEDVQAARLELPILAEEQPIVEAIRLHPVVVLCGETGSGKTTQVPQFLYEAGFGRAGSDNPGMIGITQPRRVAAMTMAARVGHELSLPPPQVAYQVRYDATTAPTTIIKFMTDGVLLRELARDFSLSKYSVIIVDEAHERSVNTDILIGVLSRVIRLREELWKEGKDGAKPLRLIIMSATLRVSDFAENTALFPTPPPILRVDARQHPVAIHFARRTYPDYVSEAIKKASKIHARLPPGGILIFLTGQNEIAGVCRKLRARYGQEAMNARKIRRVVAAQRSREDRQMEELDTVPKVAPALADVEVEEMDLGDFDRDNEGIDDGDAPRDPDPEALESDEEDEENKALGIDFEDSEAPMHILPLYSILPTDQQMRVFQPPPEGSRLVVVATNVAETSLTIPGIRYVIDCGRAKERCYDVSTGVQSFRINWISKASAGQRAGRAGRTGPGHCYRLYSSALFENHFDKFSTPEVLKMPIEGVVLQMKAMHIDTVTNFPFPTPPDRTRLHKAEVLLTRLGALGPVNSLMKPLGSSTDGPITELGKSMALFPLSPRFSKMLVAGRQHGCLPYVITVVAALSVGDPFLHEEALRTDEDSAANENEALSLIQDGNAREKEQNRIRRRAFFKSQEMHAKLGKGLSDVFRLLSVVGAYEYAGGGQNFCQEHFVRPKAMEEIHKLRAQISSIVSTNFPGLDVGFTDKLKPPSDLQLKVLRQLICSAFIDQVAVRKDLVQTTTMSGNKYSSTRGVPYRAIGISEDVYVHPSSVLYSRSPPDYVVFQEAVHSSQLWLKNLTVVNPAWLSALGKGTMCTYSKPTKNSSGELMVIPRFGPDGWELPAVKANTIS